ncbi:MAG: hypothetical protein KBT02_04210 [Treponema sp.]|nr:hypothetical protein [Candidatus Treponema caballi]
MALNSFNLAYLKAFGFDVLGVLFFGSGIIFILFADLFFTITSLFQRGMFRGWLSRK